MHTKSARLVLEFKDEANDNTKDKSNQYIIMNWRSPPPKKGLTKFNIGKQPN